MWTMDDQDLLIRRAESWAATKNRDLDVGVLRDVLELRERYEEVPPGFWPAGSAERLLLVTWPAYGAPPPDVETLRTSLDTFWGFLRATGRMDVASSAPAALRKELKRALPKMTEAYDDPARHSSGRVMGDFAREIGLDLDGAEDREELQDRLNRVTEAWNALPEEERRRRMPDPSPKSSFGASMTQMLDEELSEDLPEEGPMVEPGDPVRAAADARSSSFIRDCLRLAAWVGEGRPATARGLLKPAVAREAYQHLDLWPWERGYDRILHGAAGEETPEEDAARAEAAVTGWRSAGDCLALDRLWYAAEGAGLVEAVSRSQVRQAQGEPDSDDAWRDLAHVLLLNLCLRLGRSRVEPLLGVLMMGLVSEKPVPWTVVEGWWQEECPPELRRLDIVWGRRLEQACWLVADCALWRTVDEQHYELTDLGREFAVVFDRAREDGIFEEYA